MRSALVTQRAVTRSASIIALVAMIVGLGACGPDGDQVTSPGEPVTTPTSDRAGSTTVALPATTQELAIDADEYTFEITPDPSVGLKAGWTLLRLRNVGVEAHQVMFARIKDGVDMAELAAAGANDSSGAGAIEFVDMIGGVSYIDPGQDVTALVYLPEGLVLAMCYVPDGHGVAHALMGMSTSLTVSSATPGETAPTEPAPPEAEVVGTIELSADGYLLPADLRAGWYHVQNTDSVLHELSLLRLGSPVTDDQLDRLVEDLAANRTPAVDLDALGGMGAISPGFDGYLYLDLPAGDYLAVDFMPDPGQPRPHMLDGYVTTFRV